MKGRILDAVVAAEREHRSVALATDLDDRPRSCCSTAMHVEGDLALDDAALDRVREAWRAGRNRTVETRGGPRLRRGVQPAAALLHRRRRAYRPAAGADAGDDRLRRRRSSTRADPSRPRRAFPGVEMTIGMARRGARAAEAGPRLGGRGLDPRSRSSTTRRWPRRCARTASTSARSARAATTPGAAHGSRNWALATATSRASTARSGLSIGAVSPAEVAVSIVAQMTQILRARARKRRRA